MKGAKQTLVAKIFRSLPGRKVGLLIGAIFVASELACWVMLLVPDRPSSIDSNLVHFYNKSNAQPWRSSDALVGPTDDWKRAGEDIEEEIYPELAYRLAALNYNIDSLRDLTRSGPVVKKTRWLQHRLRSMGSARRADMVYYFRLFQFAHDYKLDASTLYERLSGHEPALSWRYFCYRYIDRARTWELPQIAVTSDKEAILLETREFPHVEFVIRNVIKNLGPGWMLTIVCSADNERMMAAIASSISRNIRILRLGKPYASANDYNNLLLTLDFWKQMRGEKLLVFHEDSILFRRGIGVFLPYDFVGSPRSSSATDVASGVGRGRGLSLRSKSVMIRALESYSVALVPLSDALRKYMELAGLERVPEDVFLAHVIEAYGVGNLPPREVAMLLVETLLPDDLDSIIGGHKFWLAMPGVRWLEYVHAKLIQHIALPSNTIAATDAIKHRGGWKHVLKAFINHDLVLPAGGGDAAGFIKRPTHEVVDILEHLIAEIPVLRPQIQNGTRLVAFMHGTLTGRYPGDNYQLANLWYSKEFIAVRSRISLLFTFSEFFAAYVGELVKLTPDMQAQVVVVKHPYSQGIFTEFKPERVLCEEACERRLVALGQQHRQTSTIYLVKTDWTKYWLPSSAISRSKALSIALAELKAMGVEPTKELRASVKIISKGSYAEYEHFLASSVLLVHLRDANANNAILDAVATSTPVIVNRHPAAVEYLGAEYPLFFDHVEEIEEILKDGRRIERAAQYLRTMDKSQFEMTTFVRAVSRHMEDVMDRY